MSGTFTINYPLLLLWLLHSCLILFLAYINPNHYTTVDSHYYLQSAGNIIAGHGYTILESNNYQWNGTFPIGYPAAIALVSIITKTKVLWASKIVNAGASGIWLFFLHRWFGKKKSVVIGCTLLLGSFLKLWAHTWSEPLFLVILSCWMYHFHYLNNSPDLSKTRIIHVFSLGLSLILVRYAGIVIIPLTFCYAVYWVYKKDNNKSLLFGLLAFLWSISFVCYLYLNKYQSGDWYGGVRFGDIILITDNFIVFSKGILNEALLIRDFDFQSFDLLFLAGTAFQSLIIIFAAKQLAQKFVLSMWIKSSLIAAFSYLIFLFTIRLFSHFDEPGYRLLSPFTFLVLCGLLNSIPEEKLTIQLKNLFIVFIVFSWVEIIPKNDLEKKVNFILQNHIILWKH